jgi:hypothetical protein
MKTPEQLAQKLVDWVATTTQLDPEKGELPNVEDWRRNAEKLIGQIIEEAREEMKQELLRAVEKVPIEKKVRP